MTIKPSTHTHQIKLLDTNCSDQIKPQTEREATGQMETCGYLSVKTDVMLCCLESSRSMLEPSGNVDTQQHTAVMGATQATFLICTHSLFNILHLQQHLMTQNSLEIT